MGTELHGPLGAVLRAGKRHIRRTITFGLLAVGLAAAGCEGCTEDKKPPPPPVELAAVPAPQGHVADIAIAKPNTTFKLIREKVAGPMALLPDSFPAAVVTMLGLSPQLLELIDPDLPMYGVITDEGARWSVVFGVHVRDGDRVVTLLTHGAGAKYTSKKDPSGVVLLEPTAEQTARAAFIGVAGNYLLTAEKPEDLIKSGPYVTRTLPKRPTEKDQIVLTAPGAALKGPVKKRVSEAWDNYRKEREKQDLELRKKHGGKAPDFGEPAAALANIDSRVSRVATLLSDLDRARLQINVDDAGTHAKLDLVPAPGGGVATRELGAMLTGDTAPLLELPKRTMVAVFFRESAETRRKEAEEQAKTWRKLLGERISDPDAKKLDDLLASWATGRGDWIAAGLEWAPEHKKLLGRGALSDSESLYKSIRGLLALLKVPAFRDPIEHHVGTLKISPPKRSGDLEITHVNRERKSKNGKVSKSEFDLAWRVPSDGPHFQIVGTEDAKAWFAAVEKEPEETLAKHEEAKGYIDALGKDVSFVFYLQPMQLVAGIALKKGPMKAASGPVVFSYGGSKTQGWFRLDVAHAAAREFARMQGRR